MSRHEAPADRSKGWTGEQAEPDRGDGADAGDGHAGQRQEWLEQGDRGASVKDVLDEESSQESQGVALFRSASSRLLSTFACLNTARQRG
ncbi:MAG: hypothetical protein HY815_10120 [Candidatus Riflebacteria bacterium]|nr:hypothetical protein [Candidatus Riflebacteria bacterium]